MLDAFGTGIALLVVTTAFFVIFVRRGSHLLAPLTFAISYVATGFYAYITLIGIEKGGAPGSPPDLYRDVPLSLAPAVLVTTLCLIWNYFAGLKTRS